MSYVSQLALENVSALKGIIQWNHEHGIRFFRSAGMLQLEIALCAILHNAATEFPALSYMLTALSCCELLCWHMFICVSHIILEACLGSLF